MSRRRRDFGLRCWSRLIRYVKRNAAIDDVFDNQDVVAFDRDVEILGDFDLPGKALVLTVSSRCP